MGLGVRLDSTENFAATRTGKWFALNTACQYKQPGERLENCATFNWHTVANEIQKCENS